MERSALTVVDDLDEELDELTMLSMMVGFRSRATQKTRIKFYAESVVPAYSSIDFKSHFRLSRETTEVHWWLSLNVIHLHVIRIQEFSVSVSGNENT